MSSGAVLRYGANSLEEVMIDRAEARRLLDEARQWVENGPSFGPWQGTNNSFIRQLGGLAASLLADLEKAEKERDRLREGDLWTKIQNQQSRLAKLERKQETVKGDLRKANAEVDRLRAQFVELTELKRVGCCLDETCGAAKE